MFVSEAIACRNLFVGLIHFVFGHDAGRATVWQCTSITGRIVFVFILGSEATCYRLCVGYAAVFLSDPEVAA